VIRKRAVSPLWQQIAEATNNGDGMTRKEKDGESELVKLNILAVIYQGAAVPFARYH
jgi:hypothetical protein